MEIEDKLLAVKDLKISFGQGENSFTAVNQISFELKKGEILGVVGESGSGKSLTALSIMQLNRFVKNCNTEGEIIWYKEKDGENLSDLSNKALEGIRGNEIAMVFQEPLSALNPVMNCGNQVAEALKKHQRLGKEEAKARVLELFEKVQLKDTLRIFRSYPHELSGGQKQRVMIAMATACNPRLLIADEATTSLDATVQQSIIELLKELKAELQMAVLFISHDLNLVSGLADRIIVMRNGQILESGTVDTVFSNPTHAYTRGLLACRPPLTYNMSRLPVIEDFEALEADVPYTSVIDRYKLASSQTVEKPNQKELLKVNNLTVKYPKRKGWFEKGERFLTAVKNVSFEVNQGQTVGLVGESGSGKTTIGKAIIGLELPAAGNIIYEDKDLTSQKNKQEIAKPGGIQMVFQDPYSSLNPRMSIGNAIMEPLLVHKIIGNKKEAIERVYELLDLVGLTKKSFDKYPNEFSGGQRQRIGIARALTLNPQLIICDECVSALDVSIQAQILNLLSDLKEERGLSFLFISHDLAVIKHMSDHILVLKEGEIVEQGSPDTIYKQPKSEYTAALIEAIPVQSHFS